MKAMKFIAAASLFAAASMANASVTIDTATGTGFVGKGDVQLAFGMNNVAFQRAMDQGGFQFSYTVTTRYVAECTWSTGKKQHEVEHKIRTFVSSMLDSTARKSNQFTGFILNGYGAETIIGAVPVVGDACPGNLGHEGVWTQVDLLSTQGGDALEAIRVVDGATMGLPITPPAVL